jgi:arylsulfatase A-like enzyme
MGCFIMKYRFPLVGLLLLSVLGVVVQTPHLDDMASKGVQFEYFYPGQQMCSPGQYASSSGPASMARTLPGPDLGKASRPAKAGRLTW